LKLDVQPFDIREAIESVIALLGERLKVDGLTLAIEVAPEAQTLEADEMRVKQILINLLSNAVKVTKAKGNIRVTVMRDGSGATRLSVKDDGPGLDAERRAKLFDPFFRGSHSTGSESVLSLSLVKRFMELHGGQVVVDSEVGQGTAIGCVFGKIEA